jgi:hypothetical protein
MTVAAAAPAEIKNHFFVSFRIALVAEISSSDRGPKKLRTKRDTTYRVKLEKIAAWAQFLNLIIAVALSSPGIDQIESFNISRTIMTSMMAEVPIALMSFAILGLFIECLLDEFGGGSN